MSVRALRRGTMAGRGAPTTVNVLQLPGTSGNYASTPDVAGNSITGDLDFRIKVALTSWTPAGFNDLIVKRNDGKAYHWAVMSDGTFFFMVSSDGVNELVNTASTAAVGFTDGTFHWLRVTREAATGDIKFYTSDDGSSWTQLGTTVSEASGNVADTTDDLMIGSQNLGTGNMLDGNVAYAELRSGIGGTVVAKFDPSTVTPAGTRNPSTFVSATGETWTINGSAWDWLTV